MNAYILEDAAGKFWQYIEPETAPYIVKDGEDEIRGESQLGGYYTLDCRPVTPEQVTMPVTVKWTRDRTGVVDLDFYGHYSEARNTR